MHLIHRIGRLGSRSRYRSRSNIFSELDIVPCHVAIEAINLYLEPFIILCSDIQRSPEFEYLYHIGIGRRFLSQVNKIRIDIACNVIDLLHWFFGRYRR